MQAAGDHVPTFGLPYWWLHPVNPSYHLLHPTKTVELPCLLTMLPTQTSISLHCSLRCLKLTPNIAIWPLWGALELSRVFLAGGLFFSHTAIWIRVKIQEARLTKPTRACFFYPYASTVQRCQTSSMFAKRRSSFTSCLRCSYEAANVAHRSFSLRIFLVWHSPPRG